MINLSFVAVYAVIMLILTSHLTDLFTSCFAFFSVYKKAAPEHIQAVRMNRGTTGTKKLSGAPDGL